MGIDWDVVIRLTQALSWPIVALVVAMLVRPLLLQILGYLPGAKVSAAGFSVEIRPDQEIERAKKEIGSEAVEVVSLELEQQAPVEEKSPPELYDAIISAWRDLTQTMAVAYFESKHLQLDWRSPYGAIDTLTRAGILDRQLADAARRLLDVRFLARRHGRGGFEDLNMTANDVSNYVASAKTLQNRIRPAD